MTRNRSDLLAIDIGNSTVACGVFRKKRLLRFDSICVDHFPKFSKNIINSGVLVKSDQIIISSVFPKMSHFLLKTIKRGNPSANIYLVGKNVFPPLKMRYDRKKLGADRLVNLYGALKLYKPPFLVIDFGTAITFDYVSKRGVFEGGLIVPGVELSGEALLRRAALLPKSFKLKRVNRLIGRTTHEALQSGLLNGFGALADGLIERFKRLDGEKLTVIATGGFAKSVAPYTRNLKRVDPDHTLRSLALIYHHEVQHDD